MSYHSTEKSRKHKEIIVEVEQPVNKDSDTYDVTFDVPAVPPTGMIHCNIIDVLYTLKVRLPRIYHDKIGINRYCNFPGNLIYILIATLYSPRESNKLYKNCLKNSFSLFFHFFALLDFPTFQINDFWIDYIYTQISILSWNII